MSLRRGNLVHYLLFVITIFTTVWCGSILFGGSILEGIFFSLTTMSMILIHEMGHYLNAKRHGMNVTLPYFIPVPFGLGTFGAVIKMKSSTPDRNVLLDVGTAGPLYGFIASVVAVAIGMALASVNSQPVSQTFGVSLLYYGMAYLIKGVSPVYLSMNPVLFGGWLGLFITMINLLPVGQLDGGHVVYALFGKSRNFRKHMATFYLLFILWGAVCLFVYHASTWLIFAIMIYLMGGVTHPPLDNEMIDLTPQNQIKGKVCIAIFILTTMPSPFML